MIVSIQNFKQQIRIALAILIGLLFLFLPIYTPITTYLINIVHLPYWVVYWKELITIVVGFLIVSDIILVFRHNKHLDLKSLYPLMLYISISIYILGQSLINNINFTSVLYGFRFELWWVGIFSLILSWKNILKTDSDWKKIRPRFVRITAFAIFGGLIISSVFSFAIYLTNQTTALEYLGYGLYRGDSAYLNPVLCHPVDAFSNSCRLSGGFTLPNHYAGYMLLALSFVVYMALQKTTAKWLKYVSYILVVTTTILIFLTYTRFALLGLIIIFSWLILTFFITVIKKFQIFDKIPLFVTKIFYGLIILIPILTGVIGINLSGEQLSKLPIFIGKQYSTGEHYRRTMSNVEIIQDNIGRSLVGYGIGTSGPAAKSDYVDITQNPIYDKYFFRFNDKWYLGEGLFVPENWYLQLIVNGGIFYALIYTFLIGLPVWRMLLALRKAKDSEFYRKINRPSNLFYIGMLTIMIGNLFLHIWENQTVALYYALLPIVLQDRSK